MENNEAALEDELNSLEIDPKPKAKKGAAQDPWKITPPKDLGDLTKIEPEELEQEIHNMEKMASVTVIEEEIRLLGELAESSKEFADVYTEKKELLEFRKDMTVQNIENGYLSLEKYTADMKKELAYDKNLLESLKMSKCKAEDVKRVETRIKLLTKEIADCEGIEAEPEPEVKEPEEVKKPAEPDSNEEEKVEEVKNEEAEVAENDVEEISDTKADEDKVEIEKVEAEKVEAEKVEAENQEEEKEAFLPVKQAMNLLKRLPTTDPSFFLAEEEDEGEIDFTKVDKKQYDAVSGRMQEYREATAYLMENGFTDESQAMLKRIDKLNKCLKLVKEGKKIDLLRIEPPLTPDIMFDCTKEKRDKLYNDVIIQLQKQSAPLQKKIDAFKKLSKKDRTRYAQQMLPIAKKAKEAELMINTLKGAAKNPWTPVPVCHIEPTYQEVDITNKDIKANILVVEYFPDQKMTKKQYYVLFYKLKHSKEATRGETEGYMNKKIEIPFPKGVKSIHECTLTLKLKGRKYFLFKPFRAKLKLKLEELEHVNEIKHQVPEFRNKYVINATIKVRLPSDGRSTKTVEGKELIVNKLYTPFRGHAGPVITQAPAKQPASVVPQSKPAAKPAAASQPPIKTEVKQAPKADPPLPKQLELPSNITAQDMVDPDNVANLICVSYLDKRITYYNNMIKQVSNQGRKVPDSIVKTVNQMVKNKATIEGQIERGVLTAENYKEFLQMQLEKDNKLLECLAKYKQEKKMVIVKERIVCLKDEINSL